MKKIFSILSIFFIFLCLNSCNFNDHHRKVRKNIHSPEAQADVEALSKALTIMRSQDCSNPTSWYYQGAIHWIPDSITNNSFCPSYHTYAEKKDAWDNCTHTHTASDEINFLVWHRLYIWHFEKIVRKISGKKDFALPYWAYTDSGSVNKTLHPWFRDSSKSVYERCRFDSLNTGFPIQGEAVRSLDLTKLMSYTSYEMFGKNIDAAPHGTIHDYVGHGNDYNDGKLWFDNPITGTKTHDGLMGWVPTAAFDPVFWTHHANIDRIWQQWTNSENGQLITLEQLEANPWNYVFFDENGRKVVYTPKQIMSILYTMDYDYDDCKLKSKVQNIPVKQNIHQVTSFDMDVAVNGQITDAVTIITPITTHKTAIVEIQVSFTDIPRGVYEVYVNNPSGVFETSSQNFAGFMTFFGKDHKLQGRPCANGCCTPLVNGRPSATFRFEIPSSQKYKFQIYKHNGNHSGDLKIESIIISQM